MPVDIGLVKTALRVLDNNRGRADLTEEVIGLDIQTILRRPLAAHQVRDALAECRRHDWAAEAQDDFGLPTWRITEQGTRKLSTL
jgi:hypothetical protein